MKKILFAITSLTLGGAERILVDVANELVNKYNITILTIYDKGEFLKELDERIKVISIFDSSFKDTNKLSRLKLSTSLQIPFLNKKIYNKYINNNYDLEIAFLEGPATWLLSESKNRKIAWVQNDISNTFGSGFNAKFKKLVNIRMYKKYNQIILVSNHNKIIFDNEFKSVLVPTKVIYNYRSSKDVIKKANQELVTLKHDHPSFVSVVRLHKQKAVDRLVKVHKRLLKNGFKHYIYILGDGPERSKIESLIDELHVKDTFILLGQKTNPYPYCKEADYFILASLYEGYPTIVTENKILNKFILTTNTSSKEAVENYPNKVIMDNNEDGIYDVMKEVIAKKPKTINPVNTCNTSINQIEDLIKEYV